MWLESDQTEPHKLWDAGTFTPVDEVPAGHKVNGCKFVRTWKGNELGEVFKPKSRLVALGYSQTKDVNYFETSSPTLSPLSIKLLTKIAVEYGLPTHHWSKLLYALTSTVIFTRGFHLLLEQKMGRLFIRLRVCTG